MNVALAVERLLGSPFVDRMLRPVYPTVALEIASGRLIAVAVDRASGVVREHRMEELPPGVVRPSLLRPGVLDPAQFRAALGRVVTGLPGFDGKLTVVLPDHVAKLSLIELENDAQTTSELRDLVRWRLKRSTPFRVEDARIALQVFRPAGDLKLRCMVALILDKTIEQIESICESLGWEIGLVDVSSFNLWNLLEARLASLGDVLILNVDDTFATAMISRGGEPAFVRCKAPQSGLPVSFDRVKEELHPTLLFYEDRIGGTGIRQVFLRAPIEVIDEMAEVFTNRYGMEVERMEVTLSGRVENMAPADLSLLAPTLGAALGR